jgi:hypothetical protein
MRLRKVVFWLLFLGGLAWIGQTVALAGWSYFVTQEVVERTLREVSARQRSALSLGTLRARDEVITDARNSILLAARREDLPLQDVLVNVTPGGISATVMWPYPVVVYGGRELLVIPMSVQRSTTASP